MLINLEELKDVPVFKKAAKIKAGRELKERKRRTAAKVQANREQKEQEKQNTVYSRNRNLLTEDERHPKDALSRLSELKEKLNKAPIGKMSIQYDKNHVLERLTIKNQEFVPYLKADFLGVMKVMRGTSEPIMEVSLEELFREFGDEDIVADMYGDEIVKTK